MTQAEIDGVLVVCLILIGLSLFLGTKRQHDER